MTRIFTDGAEMRDILFWDISNLLTVASATPAISPYYYEINGGASTVTFTALSECYFRVRYRTSGATVTSQYIGLRLGTTLVMSVSHDALGHFQANVTTVGIVGTSTMVAANNTWYLIEVYFKEANAPDGRFVVYVDGNNVIDYTGDTQPAAATTFDNMLFQASGANVKYDDIALNSTDGGSDNSYCGDGIVVKLTPSGSGTANNWVNSGSTSGSSNYTYVDEYPSDTTTYTYCSASSTGVKDKYAMSNLTIIPGNITRIFSEARIKKEAADSTTVKLGYLPDGGTDTMSGSVALYTTYAQAIGTSASANPVTGLAWTIADINALEYVIEMT